MLMVVAVPIQASAAEKDQTCLDAVKDYNNCFNNINKLEAFDLNCVKNQTDAQKKFFENFTCEIGDLTQNCAEAIIPTNTWTNCFEVTAPIEPVEQPANSPEDQEEVNNPTDPTKEEEPTQNQSIGTYEQQVADLVNQERAKQGLSPLTLNTELSSVAETKAADMRDKNYFSHTSPTYGSPFDMMKQFGISYKSAGENIAMGQKTPEVVMNGWMNSEGHRANILNANYTEIGVGYVTDSNGNTYWVQMFIRP